MICFPLLAALNQRVLIRSDYSLYSSIQHAEVSGFLQFKYVRCLVRKSSALLEMLRRLNIS